MALLSDKDRKLLQAHLAKALTAPVQLVYFTQTMACQFCRETEQLLREVADLSDKITLELHDFISDKQVATQYGIDKIPATVIKGAVDYGIRIYGIPSGYEFMTLIEGIIDVSHGKPSLADKTLEILKGIQDAVHLQVFVTPT